MVELDELTSQALDRYFSVLEKVGYMNQKDTDKLILLTFLQEMLEQYAGYITEKDYKLINSVIACLYGSSCLIPFPQYQKLSHPVATYIINTPIRITEDYIVRRSQREGERLVNN